MAELEVLNEKPVTMVELKEKLEKIRKHHELGFRANKAWEYLGVFAKQDVKEVEELKKKLEELNIVRLKESQVNKLIDLQPKDADGVKILLTGENVTLKQEDVQRIVECLK